MPVPHVPMQENTAPTQLLCQPLLYQSFRRFSIAISLISYYGGLSVSQYGVCVCTYAVWGNYILHRFLFVSAGTGPAGCGRKRPPRPGLPRRDFVHTAEAVGKEKYGRLQKNVPDDVQRHRGCDQCFGERQTGSHQCPAGMRGTVHIRAGAGQRVGGRRNGRAGCYVNTDQKGGYRFFAGILLLYRV